MRFGAGAAADFTASAGAGATGSASATDSVRASASSAGDSTELRRSRGWTWIRATAAQAPSQGQGLGVSNSVFRVMLSGSGLRTFAITAAPEFLAPATGLAHRWEWLPCRAIAGLSTRLPETCSLAADLVTSGAFSQRQSSVPAVLASKATRLLGKHQAGNGWLEGGRSSLRESAQRATLLKCSNPRFPASMQQLGRTALWTELHQKFINRETI